MGKRGREEWSSGCHKPWSLRSYGFLGGPRDVTDELPFFSFLYFSSFLRGNGGRRRKKEGEKKEGK